jgi:hypothetical protein
LNEGAFFDYSNNSGDETNPLFQPYFYAEPALVTQAQMQVDGTTPDARVVQKTTPVPTFTFAGITSALQFTLYTGTTASLAMIRNEELILMKAEAELGSGQTTAALNDINFIRETSGNLPPTTLTSASPPDLILKELLYNKRYSLLWEGGHSWIDFRQYNLLNQLPNQQPNQKFFPILPFPLADCQARSPQPSGCTTVVGN